MRAKTTLWLLLGIALAALTLSCAKRHVSSPLADQPPETWFANVPTWKDTLNSRALLYWEGSDPGGRIVAYEYVVDSPSGQWTYLTSDTSDTAFIRRHLGGSLLKVGAMTQDTIQFSVPFGNAVHTVYVRAVDNSGQRDPTPASRAVSLKNLPPYTAFRDSVGPNEGDTVFCLSAVTATWKGIPFGVAVSDTMDPDGWVAGHYYAVDDSVPNPQTWRYTTSSTCTLTGLPSGPHFFAISAKDNGDAYDPTPAIRRFTVVVPTFDQGILLVDETRNGTGNQGRWTDAQVDTFYHALLRAAGRGWADWENSDGLNPPPRTTLGRYSLVIWHSDELDRTIPSIYDRRALVSSYLDVGGKLCLIGLRNLFHLNAEVNPVNVSYDTTRFERKYFGLVSANTDLDSTFLGTYQQRSDYPVVEVDSQKVFAALRGRLVDVNVVGTQGSEVLMAFHSDPVNPQVDRLPCAVRYPGPTFRTAFFAFPFMPIKVDASMEPLATVLRNTLTYLGQ